jgi:hypothetical protein
MQVVVTVRSAEISATTYHVTTEVLTELLTRIKIFLDIIPFRLPGHKYGSTTLLKKSLRLSSRHDVTSQEM